MTTTPPATLGIAARRACLASTRAKSGSIRSKCQTSDHRKRSPVRHCAVRALCAFGRSRSHRPRRRTAACAGGGSSFFWWCSTRLPSSRHKISLRRDTSIGSLQPGKTGCKFGVKFTQVCTVQTCGLQSSNPYCY